MLWEGGGRGARGEREEREGKGGRSEAGGASVSVNEDRSVERFFVLSFRWCKRKEEGAHEGRKSERGRGGGIGLWDDADEPKHVAHEREALRLVDDSLFGA